MSALRFENVTAVAQANVYFEGKVVSHTLLFPGGGKKTLGLIYPGEYHFATESGEWMDITAGGCRIRIDGDPEWREVATGGGFAVPPRSGFDIVVESGITQYVCSFT